MVTYPLCRLCNIAYNVSEVKEDGPVGGVIIGAGKGADADGAKEAGTIVEGAANGGILEDRRVSDLFPMALQGPLKVTEGSSRFQQFFFTYAKLMAGLRLSKDSESEVTPLALHKAVMRAGKPSLEESCCAIIEI